MRLLLPLAALVLLLTPQKAAPGAVETGPPVPQRGHAFRITCGAFDPSGALLATVDETYTLKIWSWESGALLHSFAAVDRPPVFAAHAPLVLLLSGEAELRNYLTGTLLRTLRSPEQILSAAFSDEDRAVTAVTQGGWIVRWSSRGQLLARVRLPGAKAVQRAAFAPDGRTIAVSCRPTDGFSPLLLVDGRAARVVRTLDFPGEIKDVTWAREGGRLLVSTGAQIQADELWLLDCSSGKLSRLPFGGATPDQQSVLAEGKVYRAQRDGSVSVWNGDRRAWTPIAAAIPGATANWMRADGRWAATGTRDGAVHLRRLDGTVARVLPASGPQALDCVAMPRTREFVALGRTRRDELARGLIVVRDAQTGILHRSLLTGRPIKLAGVASRTNLLVTVDDNDELELRRPPGWGVVQRFGNSRDKIQGLAVDSGGTRVAVFGLRDAKAERQRFRAPGERYVALLPFLDVWRLATFERSELHRGSSEWLTAVAFAGPDERLISIDGNGVMERWDTAERGHASRLASARAVISQLRPSRDGHLLLGSAEQDPEFFAWSLRSGKLFQKFDASTPAYVGPIFTDQGRRLVIASDSDLYSYRIGGSSRRRMPWSLPAPILDLLEAPHQDGGVAVLNDFSARRWDRNLRTVWEADYLETPAGKAEWRCRARDGALIASPEAGGLYRDPSTGRPGLGAPATLLAPAAWAAHLAQMAGPRVPSGGARSVNRR